MRFSFPFDAGPFVWLLLVLAFLALVFVVERALFLHRGLVLSSDFIEGVRNGERHRATPILVLSTESAPELKSRARNAGATGWIVKPFKADSLVEAIRRVSG